YSNIVLGTTASWWSFWSYANDFVDAQYYTYDPLDGTTYSELGDYYRALLPHQFEPYAGANVLAKLPPVTYVDENGDPVVVVSEEDRIRPGLGFEGLGWQLQDGEDGLKDFDFDVYKDSLVEGDETVKLNLVLPKGYLNLGGEYIPLGVALGSRQAKMIILDDDFTPGELKFSSGEIYVNESEKTVSLSVDRVNGANGSISVQYKTKQGTAKNPFDFKSKQGSLRFASGQTSRPIVVSLADDEGQEVDEYFDIEIFNATGGGKLVGDAKLLSMRVYLVDNDLKSGKVEFTSDTASINENEGEVVVAVRRLAGSRGQGSVAYTTRSLTALSGADYQAQQGLLTWAHEDVGEKLIRIPIVDDEVSEEEEAFELSLINPQNVIVGQNAAMTVNVVDDDSPGEVTLGQSSYFINENGAQLSVYVERQVGYKGAIQVDYALADGTATSSGDFPDYLMESGTLSFEDGQVSRSLNLQIKDDYAAENTEFFSIVISNPTEGAILGSVPQAKVNIVDDESVNVPAGSIDTFFDSGVGIKVNGPVHVIKREEGGHLLIAGEFDVVNGMVRNGIARLNAKGYLDREFDVNDGLNGLIKDVLPLDDGSLILVGEFTSVNGVNKNHIVKLNSDGGLNTRFDPGSGFDATAHKIIPFNTDGDVLVVGEFQLYNGKNRRGFVVLDAAGNDVSPWSSEVGTVGKVYAAAVLQDGTIYLGGDFQQFENNEQAQKIVKLDARGNLDESFTDNFSSIYQKAKFNDGAVKQILMHPDGGLILIGEFSIKTGTGRRYSNVIKVSRIGELITGASPEDILAAVEARVAAEAVEAQLAALQAELEAANLALD
ncbi:uncharacterized protein METZ01_LOCUS146178, partial [marine metagenome]